MKKKKFLLVALVLFCTLMLTGCPPRKQFDNFPHEIGSVWQTENGELELTIREDTRAVGLIQTDEKNIEVLYSMSPNGFIEVYPVEVLDKLEEDGGLWVKDTIEQWGADYYSQDAFRVIVHESTYFDWGQEFVFHKVDTGGSENMK